jgi:hypothetical protein
MRRVEHLRGVCDRIVGAGEGRSTEEGVGVRGRGQREV